MIVLTCNPCAREQRQRLEIQAFKGHFFYRQTEFKTSLLIRVLDWEKKTKLKGKTKPHLLHPPIILKHSFLSSSPFLFQSSSTGSLLSDMASGCFHTQFPSSVHLLTYFAMNCFQGNYSCMFSLCSRLGSSTDMFPVLLEEKSQSVLASHLLAL